MEYLFHVAIFLLDMKNSVIYYNKQEKNKKKTKLCGYYGK